MKTKKSNIMRLSDAQIEVLLLGADYKLSRSSMGWSYDDRKSPLDAVVLHRFATIKSLWKRGLLDSNFIDPSGVGPSGEARLIQNLDGARFTHSPEVPELKVWASALGRKALEENGHLPAQQNLVYQ